MSTSKGDESNCPPVPLGHETHEEHDSWLTGLGTADHERWQRIQDLPTVCLQRWRRLNGKA